MHRPLLTIATRNSPLALWQANEVRAALASQHPHIEIKLLPLTTSGDRFLTQKLMDLGGKGMFLKELEEALLDKRADLAVHSMKDVPFKLPDGLGIACMRPRAEPKDAFLSLKHQNLKTLPDGAVIGTSSLRRQSQLLALNPRLKIKSLRGNIQSRIAQLEKENFDAIILAAAGLERMNLTDWIKEKISIDRMLPACGQGAMGIECRKDDFLSQELIKDLNCARTTIAVNCERQVNALLGGHCHAPIAVYCEINEANHVFLRAKVASACGQEIIYDEQSGPAEESQILALTCAQNLLKLGAEQIINESKT